MNFIQIAVSFSFIFLSLAQAAYPSLVEVEKIDVNTFDQMELTVAEVNLNDNSITVLDSNTPKQIIENKIQEIKRKEAEEKARLEKQRQLQRAKQNKKQTNKSKFVQDTQAFINYAKDRCAAYGCNWVELMNVAQCESGRQWYKYNRSSGATGIMQFMPRTFKANAGYMGKPHYNIWNPYHQIDVAAWMFSRNQQKQWVCKG